VLTVTQAPSAAAGLMGLLSIVMAVPIAISARWLTLANRGLQAAVGLVTIAIGVNTIVATTLA
jgi:hypothetical protein